MEVFRMAKVTVIKEQNYTTIDNAIFKDTRISFKAKGLLTTMLSLPPTWNYTIEGLSKLSKDGKDSIKTAMKELENYGYLERKQTRNDNGSFCDLEYFVYEKPHTKEPLAENPSTGKSSTENPLQLNTNKLNTNKLNTNNKNNTLSVERAVSECVQEPDKPKSKPVNKKKEADELFDRLWSLYPLKKGKASVSDAQKLKLLDIGYEEMERAISRYIQYVDSVDYLHYKNGSTFFNSGYIDYLDVNCVPYVPEEGKKKNKKKNTFQNFPQREYDYESLERQLLLN